MIPKQYYSALMLYVGLSIFTLFVFSDVSNYEFLNYDDNEFNVTINYYIVGIDALPQQLTFALQPTR